MLLPPADGIGGQMAACSCRSMCAVIATRTRFGMSPLMCEQDEAARLSAAHAEALSLSEQDAASARAAAAAEADGRVAAAKHAVDAMLSELSTARDECQTLLATLEQVPSGGLCRTC